MLLYFKAKNMSSYMPQTRVQYLCNFLCNPKNNITEFVFVQESGVSGAEVVKRRKCACMCVNVYVHLQFCMSVPLSVCVYTCVTV